MNSRKPGPASALKAHAPSPAAARHPLPSNGRGLSDSPLPSAGEGGAGFAATGEGSNGFTSKPTWILTIGGKKVDLLNPTPDDIEITDISTALSRIPRWNGYTHEPLSVAQHCVWVSRRVEQPAAPYAFLHDAHEAYLNDLSSPLKAAIRALLKAAGCDIDPIKMLADRFDAAIHARFGLPWPMQPHYAIAVRYADMEALAIERRDQMPDHPAWAEIMIPAAPSKPINPMTWSKAQDQFMARFHELFGDPAQAAPSAIAERENLT